MGTSWLQFYKVTAILIWSVSLFMPQYFGLEPGRPICDPTRPTSGYSWPEIFEENVPYIYLYIWTIRPIGPFHAPSQNCEKRLLKEVCRISLPFLNPSSLLLMLVTFKLCRLDMKLVARDVKTIFRFSWVCFVMGSSLLSPLFYFAISKFSQGFSSYPCCIRQGML